MSVCLVGQRDRQRLWQVCFGRVLTYAIAFVFCIKLFTYLLTYFLSHHTRQSLENSAIPTVTNARLGGLPLAHE